MSAITSHRGEGVSAHIPDYPHPVPGWQKAIRNALWSIETGMGGRVEWAASFGERQTTVFLNSAQACFGSKLDRLRV